MWPRRRTLCAALALFFGLWGLSSAWASPTSPPSALPPGSGILSAEDYLALEGALIQAQQALSDSSQTIKQQSEALMSSSSVITTQSEALKASSKVIVEQARLLTRLSNVCAVLGVTAGVEAVILAVVLLFM